MKLRIFIGSKFVLDNVHDLLRFSQQFEIDIRLQLLCPLTTCGQNDEKRSLASIYLLYLLPRVSREEGRTVTVRVLELVILLSFGKCPSYILLVLKELLEG